MNTKNVALGLFVSIMAVAPEIRAMENPINDETINTTSTTTTCSITNSTDPQIQDLKKAENPYKTGFWDQLIHNSEMPVEEKIKMAQQRIERKRSLYDLFISQLNEFIRQNVKNNSTDQETAKAIKSFFTKKLERIEGALFELESRFALVEGMEHLKEDETYPYKIYSGKLNKKPKEQAAYALHKYIIYRGMSEFIEFNTINPPILNPILAKTIFADVRAIKEEGNRTLAGLTRYGDSEIKDVLKKWDYVKTFTAVSQETHFVQLHKEDTLSFFITTSLQKWKGRLDAEQKRNLFLLPMKSLPDSLKMFDDSKSVQLALEESKLLAIETSKPSTIAKSTQLAIEWKNRDGMDR